MGSFDDDGKLKIKGLDDSLDGVRGAKKYLAEVAKAAPLVGLTVSAVVGSKRVEAAARDDADYVTMMALLQAEPHFENYSLKRELAVIAGEEGLSEAGSVVGGAVGSVCGPWCIGGGAVIGGVGGDYLGGYLAGREFDRRHAVSDEELEELLRELR